MPPPPPPTRNVTIEMNVFLFSLLAMIMASAVHRIDGIRIRVTNTPAHLIDVDLVDTFYNQLVLYFVLAAYLWIMVILSVLIPIVNSPDST